MVSLAFLTRVRERSMFKKDRRFRAQTSSSTLTGADGTITIPFPDARLIRLIGASAFITGTVPTCMAGKFYLVPVSVSGNTLTLKAVHGGHNDTINTPGSMATVVSRRVGVIVAEAWGI